MQKLNRLKEKLLLNLDSLIAEKTEHEKILSEEKLSLEEIRTEKDYVNILTGKILELNDIIKIIDIELYG
ncbi:hypothetical protein [Clostridium sp. 1001283B150210_160208_E6]|uniref:hypothetical protein n=1 Tax=Clostridium sp. 1001283B150210_160208_E6 TaxID=2787129 RepID=UPI0018AA1FED|nr:hypothetical protein [Clostridium sp. 1001283B150210_160208_E6]